MVPLRGKSSMMTYVYFRGSQEIAFYFIIAHGSADFIIFLANLALASLMSATAAFARNNTLKIKSELINITK